VTSECHEVVHDTLRSNGYEKRHHSPPHRRIRRLSGDLGALASPHRTAGAVGCRGSLLCYCSHCRGIDIGGNCPKLTFGIYAAHFEKLRVLKCSLQAQYPERIPLPWFKWQKSFHDHIIRNERDYFNHLNYIYHNAVKHRLVGDPEDWPFMWIEGMPEPPGFRNM